MSLETWKKEFYPVIATAVSKKDALSHSLKKWQGLAEENLVKHAVIHTQGILSNEEHIGFELEINGVSCALCTHYLEVENTDNCCFCPIKIELGHTCNTEYDEEDHLVVDLYAEALNGKIKPMLDILTLCKQKEDAERKKEAE